MSEDHNSLRGLAMAARGILMGIAPIEKCLRVAQAQVAPIVFGRREWG